MSRRLAFIVLILSTTTMALGQTEGARISGRVTDPSDAVLVGAEFIITDLETDVSITTTTNADGIYVVSNLRPGTYRLTIQKQGFRTIVRPQLQLYVQDAVSENFKLDIGLMSESITVEGGNPGLQTDSSTVSTVVDQKLIENMPLNGRSFQSLIALTPGVVFTSQDSGQGQFSVNGQRSDGNYFTVDGVSANFGAIPGHYIGQTTGGTTPGLTSTGGTNGLVSVDAMQEFRIQTSSYAPEFGRGPGAQVSIVTKSGTNRFHGTVFDYVRNDIFDARNWFDAPPAPKPPLRQNDFGGTIGGPLMKDKTFFFFSYEGLRLRQPQTSTGLFYTASARAAAAPAYQPFINALPLPTSAPTDPTCDNVTNPCLAPITVSYSNPFRLNATSVRIDHNLKGNISLFARYNHAPSQSAVRSWEEVTYDNANTDTVTLGATILFTHNKVNDFRANWSRNTGSATTSLTNFYGAVVPPDSALFPSPFSPAHGQALVVFPDGDAGGDVEIRALPNAVNVQRQLNFVDTFSWAVGTHLLKFGIDYRRMNPSVSYGKGWGVFPSSFSSIVAGTADVVYITASDPLALKMSNYSLFGQDTWKATSLLTLTYGLRWEINTPPVSATSGQPLYTSQGVFDSNPLALVPGDLWHTRFGDFAPRFGAAYQVTPKTVIRGGFGLFYDMGYASAGSALGGFPYYRTSLSFGVPFDLSSAAFQPPSFSTSINDAAAQQAYFSAFDPNLRLPYTMQWNAAIERGLGAQQTLTVTYLGSDGRRLLRADTIVPPQLDGGGISATRNAGYSHYNALQVQFQRHMSHGLQALLSYSFAKSSDIGSSDAGSATGLNGTTAESVRQIVLPPLTPSDFDLRHTFSGAVSYEIPTPAWGRVGQSVLKNWAVDGLVRVTSAPPLNVQIGVISPVIGPYVTRPDRVPGQPYWIKDPSEPGGKALNPKAFARPAPGTTGNFPRNGLRSIYSLDQTDVALRRRFNLNEHLKLDVRVEYFNVFNHPMFGAPGAVASPYIFWGYGSTALPYFGKVAPGNTMNVAWGGVSGLTSGQSSLYAVGGPRSGQFTLKLAF